MNHHGDSPKDDPMRKLVEKLGLGATGQYPHGSLGPHDEGELRAAIGVEGGKVVLHFGKSVAWLAVTPAQARELANVLIQKSYAAEAGV